MDPVKGFDPIFMRENESESRRHIIEEATGATRVPSNHDDLDPLASSNETEHIIGRCKEVTPNFPTMTRIDLGLCGPMSKLAFHWSDGAIIDVRKNFLLVYYHR